MGKRLLEKKEKEVDYLYQLERNHIDFYDNLKLAIARRLGSFNQISFHQGGIDGAVWVTTTPTHIVDMCRVPPDPIDKSNIFLD